MQNEIKFHDLGTELFWVYHIRIDGDNNVNIDIRHGEIVGIKIYRQNKQSDIYIEYTTKVTEDGPVSFISHSKSFLSEKEAVDFYLKNKISEVYEESLKHIDILNIYKEYLTNLTE